MWSLWALALRIWRELAAHAHPAPGPNSARPETKEATFAPPRRLPRALPPLRHRTLATMKISVVLIALVALLCAASQAEAQLASEFPIPAARAAPRRAPAPAPGTAAPAHRVTHPIRLLAS